jgi:hypothetical protein
MAHRPYPSAVRARHQVARHAHHEDVPVARFAPTAAQVLQAMGVAFQPNGERILANLRAAVSGMPRLADLIPAALPSDPGSRR